VLTLLARGPRTGQVRLLESPKVSGGAPCNGLGSRYGTPPSRRGSLHLGGAVRAFFDIQGSPKTKRV
jgi:hypothetical protein